jgi:hypothetical protein
LQQKHDLLSVSAVSDSQQVQLCAFVRLLLAPVQGLADRTVCVRLCHWQQTPDKLIELKLPLEGNMHMAGRTTAIANLRTTV